GEPAYSGASAFKDISENEYYAIPVAWAAAQNLVKGYSDERFGPNDPVTREQMAFILMNYALSTGLDVSAAADLSAFIDAESVSDWAERAVSWANAAGLLNGSGGKLMPAGNATRAEVAAVLHRFALGSTR
ncbi:MAG TPA: S-layer homology domain-containing protein, partial [Clostridiales bacterium]|nr:S-layer homology domain-containing protein [Clostridiales bacterium]